MQISRLTHPLTKSDKFLFQQRKWLSDTCCEGEVCFAVLLEHVCLLLTKDAALTETCRKIHRIAEALLCGKRGLKHLWGIAVWVLLKFCWIIDTLADPVK